LEVCCIPSIALLFFYSGCFCPFTYLSASKQISVKFEIYFLPSSVPISAFFVLSSMYTLNFSKRGRLKACNALIAPPHPDWYLCEAFNIPIKHPHCTEYPHSSPLHLIHAGAICIIFFSSLSHVLCASTCLRTIFSNPTRTSMSLLEKMVLRQVDAHRTCDRLEKKIMQIAPAWIRCKGEECGYSVQCGCLIGMLNASHRYQSGCGGAIRALQAFNRPRFEKFRVYMLERTKKALIGTELGRK
jgi:hypothetical protein